jgi:polyhydroxyalkanoate synthase
MYIASPMDIIQQFSAVTNKLLKGYEALKKVKQIDIGTSPKEKIWNRDKIEVYHYLRKTPAKTLTPVLIIYALVNRHHMMDIQEDKSYIRNLLHEGLDLYLINWSDPSPEDKFFTMEEYIMGYLNDAVNVVCKAAKQNAITLMGICQGGTFSVIYSALSPHKIKNLITLVTPIDFHTTKDSLSLWARHLNIDALVHTQGNISGEFLNNGFEMLKPMLKLNKYINMMSAIENEKQLIGFLRMESWIADSPDQAGECLKKFIKDLYQENKLVKGTMQLGNQTIDLKNVTMPLLNIYAEDDHLVPPESSIKLNELVGSEDKCLTKFAGGHIGVFVGSRSQKELAPAIASWLKERDTYV